MSQGFGSTKQPDSCSARNFAARDVCVDFISQHYAAPARARFPFGLGAPSAVWDGCVAGRHLACRSKRTGRSARCPTGKLPVLRSAAHFPDLPQWTVSAVDRIVIGNWQSCDGAIGFWAFARQTAKQIPLASIRVSSHNAKIRTRADVVMGDTRRNENDVTGADLDGLAVLATKSQSCGAIIDTERFVRRAVIMSKGIDAVPPGVAPIVLSESALEDGRAILRVRRDCRSIQ